MHINPTRLWKTDRPRFVVVLDAEVFYDHAAHARYQAAERFDPADLSGLPARKVAKDPRVRPRWPCHRITTLSWLVLSDGDDGLHPHRLVTVGMPEAGEAAILARFFTDVGRLGDNIRLVTWGGHHSDMPQILLGAMAAGLQLPGNLLGLLSPWRREATGHIDLSSRVYGGADAVHLAEVAAALRIPAKLTCKPTEVSLRMKQGKWSNVRSVAEGDVLTTAMILMLWRHLSGESLSRLESVQRLARFVAEHCAHRDYAQAWADFAQAEFDAAFLRETEKATILAPQFSPSIERPFCRDEAVGAADEDTAVRRESASSGPMASAHF